jgi:hypothetical protein
MAATLEIRPAGSEAKKLNGTNGSVASTRWILGVGTIVIVGGGSFFATSYLQDIKDRLIKIEAKQDRMQEDIAELRAATKIKP